MLKVIWEMCHFNGISLIIYNYLFMTYIVTSKPKRISVAAGVVHIVDLLSFRFICELYAATGFGVTVKSLNNAV